MSRVHIGAVVTTCEFRENTSMPLDTAAIKKRTRAVREAIGKGPVVLSVELGLPKNAWTQFENPKDKRCITLNAATRLRETYHVSLDWLYFGDRLADMPGSLQRRLREVS